MGAGSAIAGLTAVGLRDLADLPARMLSAGQKRRLALARLVVSRAPLWLLDEPTLGLDAGAWRCSALWLPRIASAAA